MNDEAKAMDGCCFAKLLNGAEQHHEPKEIIERRYEDPIRFLFLPKMGLLFSQASTEKKWLNEL